LRSCWNLMRIGERGFWSLDMTMCTPWSKASACGE
jgi:hypothetical protein